VHALYTTPEKMCLRSRGLFKFRKISGNISETVQYRYIVAVKD